MTSERIETMKHVGDWASAGIAVGALAAWLPPIASLLTIIWMLIRFYDRIKHGPQNS